MLLCVSVQASTGEFYMREEYPYVKSHLSQPYTEPLDEETVRLLLNRILHQPESEETGNFDYSDAIVSDVKNPSVWYIGDVLEEIKVRLSRLAVDKPLKICLKDNSLKDEGFTKLADFILSNDCMKKNLIRLNLRNNRLTGLSLQQLKKILETCTQLRLNISVNLIGLREFNGVFTDNGLRDRIKFSAV